MSTSPFMDGYSSEDYSDHSDHSDHDDDYYIVPAATSPQQVRTQVETQTPSSDLQNLIIDQHVDVSESVYFDVLPDLEAQTAPEEGSWMEQSVYLPVESYFDLDAQAASGVAAVLEAQPAVEELAAGSYFDLEARVETGDSAALDTETALEEGDLIESESLETMEADTVVETVESMIEGFIYEAEDAIDEPYSDVEHEAGVAFEAETAIEEGDVIGEIVYEAEESDYDFDAEAEEMVEEGVVVEEAEDVAEEADDVVEEHLESGNNPQAEAEALIEEGAATEEAIYEPPESNSELQAAEEPEAPAEEPAVSIGMSTFKAKEPYSGHEPEEPDDLSDEQSDSWEEESDLSEGESDLIGEEWDLATEESDTDPEDSDMDSSDSDMDSSDSDSRTTDEEPEDDEVVADLKSSVAPIRSGEWKSLVPAWAKLPVYDTPTVEDSCLLESFLGCGPLLMLQECGNAVMNVIETFLCELARIRDDLRRVLGALFRQKETTKHA